MIELFLQASLLVGITTSSGLGEIGPAPLIAAEVKAGPLELEGGWSDLDKYTGAGWYTRGAADVWLGPLSAGVGYTYRNGGPWSKDAIWSRLGIGVDGVRVLWSMAHGTPNREQKFEMRLRIRHHRLVLEPRYFVEHHSQGLGHGLSVLIGGSI